jgi:diketogulonate reductase-like aldo/keto reductase
MIGMTVPAITLADGVQLPMVGFGTWNLRGHQAHVGVRAALAVGYRHLDTATMYGNEAEIGRALADSGLDRGELFLTTKIRASDAGRERSVLRKSLRALGTDYVDLWLVHWPPSSAAARRQLWNELRGLRDEGLARAIGVSNYRFSQLDDLIAATGEAPAVNQIHWNPWRYDSDVVAGHKQRSVTLEGYSPLKGVNLGDPVLTEVAAGHGVSTAQVVLRWHLEHGIPVIPRSSKPDRIAANFDLFGFTLSAKDVTRINSLGRR